MDSETHNGDSGSLAAQLGGDPSIERWQQVTALSGQLSRPAVEQLLGYLGDPDPMVRWQAGIALGATAQLLRRRARLGMPIWASHSSELSYSALLLSLRQELRSPGPERRAAAADALALWDHEAVVGYLVEALRDPEPLVRVSAVCALGKVRDKAAVDALGEALHDPSTWVRRAAADAMGAIADPKGVPMLQKALSDPQRLVRASVVAALGHVAIPKARQILEQCLHDEDATIRWHATRGLRRIGTLAAVAPLRELRTEATVLFGQTTGEIAAMAIEAIERRERGLWSWLRRGLFALWYRLTRKRDL